MGCASAKHVSTVQNDEDTQNGKSYQNGDAFCDEYRIKPVEEVKYMKNGEEEEQKIVQKNQENLEIICVTCGLQTVDLQMLQNYNSQHARTANGCPGLLGVVVLQQLADHCLTAYLYTKTGFDKSPPWRSGAPKEKCEACLLNAQCLCYHCRRCWGSEAHAMGAFPQASVTQYNIRKEKSVAHNIRPKNNTEAPRPGQNQRINIHISESQQEFFRLLDEKIEKGRDYCSEEEDIT